jgi:NACalpha-BTF3-like transcription factor
MSNFDNINRTDISCSSYDLLDSSLNPPQFYRFNQFFENYLTKINISTETFYKNINSKDKDLFLQSDNIRKNALQQYQDTYPEDYKQELEYQTHKYKKEQEERKKLQEEYNVVRKEEQIKMIMRQTNYDYEIAKQKLEEYNNNTIQVILDYVKSDSNKCSLTDTSATLSREKSISNKQPKSTNQQIYSHIRNFLGYQER